MYLLSSMALINLSEPSLIHLCFISSNDFQHFHKGFKTNPTRNLPGLVAAVGFTEARQCRSCSWKERMFILDGFLSLWLLSVNSPSGKKIIFLQQSLAIKILFSCDTIFLNSICFTLIRQVTQQGSMVNNFCAFAQQSVRDVDWTL